MLSDIRHLYNEVCRRIFIESDIVVILQMTNWRKLHRISNISEVKFVVGFLLNPTMWLYYPQEIGGIAIGYLTFMKWIHCRVSNIHKGDPVGDPTSMYWNLWLVIWHPQRKLSRFFLHLRGEIIYRTCDYFMLDFRWGFIIVEKWPKFNQRLKKERIFKFPTSICRKSDI